MFGLIVMIAAVYWIGTKFGDGAGVIAVAAMIVILIAIMISEDHKNTRAWWNRRYYWMTGKEPPGWKRERELDERRRHERIERNRRRAERKPAMDNATSEREAHMEDLRSGKETIRTVSAGNPRVCYHCGRRVREDGKRAISGLEAVTAYKCPVCGYGSVTRM